MSEDKKPVEFHEFLRKEMLIEKEFALEWLSLAIDDLKKGGPNSKMLFTQKLEDILEAYVPNPHAGSDFNEFINTKFTPEEVSEINIRAAEEANKSWERDNRLYKKWGNIARIFLDDEERAYYAEIDGLRLILTANAPTLEGLKVEVIKEIDSYLECVKNYEKNNRNKG